jgi:hypothetical protein
MYLNQYCPEPILKSIKYTYEIMALARSEKAKQESKVVSCVACGRFVAIGNARREYNAELDANEYFCPRCRPAISVDVIKCMEVSYGKY